MIKGDKSYLDDLAKNYTCKDDGGALTVTWHAGENSYVLRCGQGHFPEEVTPIRSMTAEFKQSTEFKGDPKTALLPRVDLGSGELLDPRVLEALVGYAVKYELDPYRGHVVLMYGKPYVTLDGYLYHANMTNNPYKLASRPLKEEERKDYIIKEGDHAWLSTVTKEYSGSEFTGLGIVTQDEMTEMSKKDKTKLRSPVVAAHPWQLAQKRAEWQALRRAFPIGAPEEKENGSSD